MLAYATGIASADKRPFNIHDDLLAYPQVCHETQRNAH
jgi:hypothetical protein